VSTLSIIIITKNEAINILDCINSASFADEVIVIDSGSDDGTIDLVKTTKAKLFTNEWPGYGKQKNRAIETSTGDWIFSLDADERIPEALAKEILTAILKEEHKVYDVPRTSLYISRFMKHSGWSPDRTKRLFKKDAARFSERMVHESLITTESVGHLKEPVIHYSFRDFETVLNKINHYSSQAAEEMFNAGKQGSLKKALTHGAWAFFRTYIIRAGFLDGKAGLMLSISNAEGVYYRYIKLMKLNEKNANDA
jgi:glycosyltransferase involved in cell wall biosynthesis